jgi:hypothetical protein
LSYINMLPHLLVTNRRIERLLRQRIYISHQAYNTEFVKSLGSRFSPLFFISMGGSRPGLTKPTAWLSPVRQIRAKLPPGCGSWASGTAVERRILNPAGEAGLMLYASCERVSGPIAARNLVIGASDAGRQPA